MDGVHLLRPWVLLLLARFSCLIARTARTTIAAKTSALAVATEAATATVVTIAVAIGLAHHRGGAFLEVLDANAQIAEHVFADPFLALDLGNRRRWRIDVEQ